MKEKKITAVVFIAILLILPILTFVLPKEEFSQMENRMLKTFPSFNAGTVFDRSFMNDFDTYVSDHFFGRDTWVGFKGGVEYTSGKRENNGVIIGDNRLFGRIDEPDRQRLDGNIEAIINFSTNYGIQPYLMIVPSAGEIQADLLPAYASATTWNQLEVIRGINARLEAYVKSIDVYQPLYDHREDAIYYRTDHHWTTEGAYLAYVEAGKHLQYDGLNMGLFTVETVSNEFYGTLYSSAGYRDIDPDLIEIYSYGNSNIKVEEYSVFNGSEEILYEDIYFREYLEEKDKYALFLGQNQPIVSIRTNAGTGKNILIFKDSYSHAMAPFLIEADYSEITLVDLRYLNVSYTNFLDLEDYDQVLLLYSIDTFVNYGDIRKIDW